jgi:hypothetical protein
MKFLRQTVLSAPQCAKSSSPLGFRVVRGASMIETIVVFPFLMFTGMAIVHLGLLYQAKSNLDYAAFMGAKVASSIGFDSAEDRDKILIEIRYRMAPTDSIDAIGHSDGALLGDIQFGVPDADKIRLTIVRPTRAIFSAYGEGGGCGSGVGCFIPNDNLINEDTSTVNIPGEGDISIQDANILTLRVEYYVETGVPFMQPLNTLLSDRDPTGAWVRSDATILMQTRAVHNSFNNAWIEP